MLNVLLWTFTIFNLITLGTAGYPCCYSTVQDSNFTCPGTKCTCDYFPSSCLRQFSDPEICQVYMPCDCCLDVYEKYVTEDNLAPGCSCSPFSGGIFAEYRPPSASDSELCSYYTPADIDETSNYCCLEDLFDYFEQWSYLANQSWSVLQELSCVSQPGTVNISGYLGCTVWAPKEVANCCALTNSQDGIRQYPANSCMDFPGATNYTFNVWNSNSYCWGFGQIQYTTGCGCSNFEGVCDCEVSDSSVYCNTTFLDGSWGLILNNTSVDFNPTPVGFPAKYASSATQYYSCTLPPPSSSSSLWWVYTLIGVIVLIIICCSVCRWCMKQAEERNRPRDFTSSPYGPGYTLLPPPSRTMRCPDCKGDKYIFREDGRYLPLDLAIYQEKARKCVRCGGNGNIPTSQD